MISFTILNDILVTLFHHLEIFLLLVTFQLTHSLTDDFRSGGVQQIAVS